MRKMSPALNYFRARGNYAVCLAAVALLGLNLSFLSTFSSTREAPEYCKVALKTVDEGTLEGLSAYVISAPWLPFPYFHIVPQPESTLLTEGGFLDARGSFLMCEHLLFSAILRQHNDMESVVIDVGGNAGVFTNLFASFPNVGQVYTFEASPKTFKRLQASVCVNDNVRKVHLFNCGVSEKDEIINLSHLWHSGQTTRVATGGDVRVPSHPMDAVLLDKVKNHGHALAKAPVLMKLDCEGCELGALQGATRMLRKYPPKYIFFEYTSGDPKDFLNILVRWV